MKHHSGRRHFCHVCICYILTFQLCEPYYTNPWECYHFKRGIRDWYITYENSGTVSRSHKHHTIISWIGMLFYLCKVYIIYKFVSMLRIRIIVCVCVCVILSIRQDNQCVCWLHFCAFTKTQLTCLVRNVLKFYYRFLGHIAVSLSKIRFLTIPMLILNFVFIFVSSNFSII